MHPNTITRNMMRRYGFDAIRQKCLRFADPYVQKCLRFVDRYVRRPAAFYALILWGTVIWGLYIYPTFSQFHAASWFIGASAVALILASICFVLVRYSSPGFVPADPYVHEDGVNTPKHSHASDKAILKWFESLFLVERTSTGSYRTCHQCANRHYQQLGLLRNERNGSNRSLLPPPPSTLSSTSVVITVAKPDRAHHCSHLNRCVLKLDHYCPITGNTIGLYNHKNFVLFLIYITLYTYFIAASTLLVKSNVLLYWKSATTDNGNSTFNSAWFRANRNQSWLPDLWSTAQRRAHFVANLGGVTMGVASQAPEWLEMAWHLASETQWIAMFSVAVFMSVLLSWYTWHEHVWAGCMHNTTAIERAIADAERKANEANDDDDDDDDSDSDSSSDDDDIQPQKQHRAKPPRARKVVVRPPSHQTTPIDATTHLPSRYDRGTWCNLRDVFGEYIWQWPLPQFAHPPTPPGRIIMP